MKRLEKVKRELREKLIRQLLIIKNPAREDVFRLKRRLTKGLDLPCPSNIDLLRTYHALLKNKRIKSSKIVEEILKVRPIRSLSGIVNVSVLTKPYPCPGKCIFCPTEKGFPKSYLTGEPAAERAKNLGFNPYWQTKRRIEMLKSQGHPTDKIELRIVGGTFSFYPQKYQTWFIKRCFEAANSFSSKGPERNKTLGELQRRNETAENRIVGLSVETRPDFITKKEILRLRKLGVTLVELGVQCLDDKVLKKCQTGLSVEKIAKATKLLKENGFKVLYQAMPGLPGSNLKKDLKCFKKIFQDEKFKPDWLKIYPCVVCKETGLFKIWKKGGYKPYSEEELVNLLLEIKKALPYWVRLTRVFRDIPSPEIVAGCKVLNLREVIKKEMEKRKFRCRCIRCREVGEKYDPKEKIYLFREDYQASGGKEIFLSFENKKKTKIFSFLRLRINFQEKNLIPVLRKAALVRELQTFGIQVPISQKSKAPQHRGLGKKLIKEAEGIAEKEFCFEKLAIISGIGAREYYRKLEYNLEDTYMVKNLSQGKE